MCSADVLLHRSISFFPDTSLAAAGVILIIERTDDLIIDVRDREARRERRPGRHREAAPLWEVSIREGLETGGPYRFGDKTSA